MQLTKKNETSDDNSCLVAQQMKNTKAREQAKQRIREYNRKRSKANTSKFPRYEDLLDQFSKKHPLRITSSRRKCEPMAVISDMVRKIMSVKYYNEGHLEDTFLKRHKKSKWQCQTTDADGSNPSLQRYSTQYQQKKNNQVMQNNRKATKLGRNTTVHQTDMRKKIAGNPGDKMADVQAPPILLKSEGCKMPPGYVKGHIICDPYNYKHVYKNGKPTYLGGGTFGRVYLLQNGNSLFALKAFLEEHSTYLDVQKEYEMTLKANTMGVGPRCYGLFPFVVDFVYIPWGLLLEYIGDEQRQWNVLSDLIDRHAGTMEVSDKDWLDIMINVCQQVHALNTIGMAVQDITLSNVMVHMSNGRNRVKLIDFGKARSMNGEFEDKNSYDFQRVRYMMGDITRHVHDKNLFIGALEMMNLMSQKSWSDVIEYLKRQKYLLRYKREVN